MVRSDRQSLLRCRNMSIPAAKEPVPAKRDLTPTDAPIAALVASEKLPAAHKSPTAGAAIEAGP
jgi:hypothetical protein